MRCDGPLQALLVALLFGGVLPHALAAELVVVEARGVALKPGQILDDTKPLHLQQGQHVTVISSEGARLTLDGPFENSPASEFYRAQDVIGLTMLGFVTQSTARVVGGTSRAGKEVDLPDPWLLDVSRRGNVCLRQGDKPVFWRESWVADAILNVMPGDRTWSAKATWPAGADRVIVDRDLPVRDGATLVVVLNGEASAITVRNVPTSLTSDPMRAAWMANQGCEAQAEALLRSRR